MNSTKAFVVTGASTGIGEACAIGLYDRGHIVYAGVRNDEAAARIKNDRSDRMRPLQIDVTNQDDIARAADTVKESLAEATFGGIVNNAGISVAAPLEFIPIDRFQYQMEVNVTGQVAVTQAFLPMLREYRGRIVFIGSTSGFISTPLQGAYCASKHAIEAIADTFRLELKPWGIEVACIQPGMIKTPIWNKSSKAANDWLDQAPEDVMKLYGPTIDAISAYAAKAPEISAPVEVVVRDVVHALTAPRPRTRYLNGEGARPQRIISRLPDRLRDWVLQKFISI